MKYPLTPTGIEPTTYRFVAQHLNHCATAELNPICNLLVLLGAHHILHVSRIRVNLVYNPLNAKLNPICHLLVLLGAHHILHVSRIRVNHCATAVSEQPKFKLPVSPIFKEKSNFSNFLHIRMERHTN